VTKRSHKTFAEVVIHEPRGVRSHESDSPKQPTRSLMTARLVLPVFVEGGLLRDASTEAGARQISMSQCPARELSTAFVVEPGMSKPEVGSERQSLNAFREVIQMRRRRNVELTRVIRSMKTMTATSLRFSELTEQLQDALWFYDSLFDLGNGTVLAVDYPDLGNVADTCPNHKPIVAVVSIFTGEEIIKVES
jgi:hypothetical protein